MITVPGSSVVLPLRKAISAGTFEDHVAGRPVLHGLAVDDRLDGECVGIGNVLRGDQRRAQRTEGGEGLAPAPLAPAPLQLPVTGADVVAAGVPQHVVQRLFASDVVAAPADHHGQLRLVVHLVAAQPARQHDVSPGVLHRRRQLHEENGLLGRLGARLLRVLAVVQPDAQHPGRHHRRQQARPFDHRAVRGVQRDLPHAPRGRRRPVVDGDDRPVVPLPAVPGRAVLLVAYDSHVASHSTLSPQPWRPMCKCMLTRNHAVGYSPTTVHPWTGWMNESSVSMLITETAWQGRGIPRRRLRKHLPMRKPLGGRLCPPRPDTVWGYMRCCEASRSGCEASVWSTPRNPGNHAKQLRRAIERCPH